MRSDRRAAGVGASRVALAGLGVAVVALAAPFLLCWAGADWLVRTFGAAAPSHALGAGLAGAVLAGTTVTVVLAALRATPPVFLGAWVGTTLLRLAVLAGLSLLPVAGAGATQGCLVGYASAVVLGCLLEVPAVLAGAPRPAEVRA